MFGIGIDEDTSIVAKGTASASSAPIAVDLENASEISGSGIAEGEPDAAVSIHDLALHMLSSGDPFDLVAR